MVKLKLHATSVNDGACGGLVIDVLLIIKGTITLPVSRSILNGIRVLVVEDDDDTRDLLSYVLGSHGATVFLSGSVADGLAILRKERPNVVVTDIGMPGHNGYAFIAAVRKEEAREIRNTPTIALTAFATPTDRDIAMISGFNEYLTKPFEPGELVLTIKRLYDHSIDSAA
jgi:CheY-like chemotaxis protein